MFRQIGEVVNIESEYPIGSAFFGAGQMKQIIIYGTFSLRLKFCPLAVAR